MQCSIDVNSASTTLDQTDGLFGVVVSKIEMELELLKLC